jgi:integrase
MSAEFKVRVKEYPHRKNYVVECPSVNGKRVRRFFKSEQDAETYAEGKRTEIKNYGLKALSLPDDVRSMASEAIPLLAPYGKTLRDAVTHYVRHLESASKSCVIQELIKQHIERKVKQRFSQVHLADIRYRMKRFESSFGRFLASEITTSQVEDWLSDLDLSIQSRNNFRAALHALFAFAKSRGYVAANPVEEIPKLRVPDQPVGILKPEEIASLLNAAPSEMIPYYAIGAFAGLRTSELQRLEWKEIDLESGFIEITGAKSKTAARRLVTIQPNLRDWLDSHRNKKGQVCPERFRTLAEATRIAAKMTTWPHNALRHSFVSYHLAHFKDAARLALELGHTSPHLLFRHYREVVRPADAERYWIIVAKK